MMPARVSTIRRQTCLHSEEQMACFSRTDTFCYLMNRLNLKGYGLIDFEIYSIS